MYLLQNFKINYFRVYNFLKDKNVSLEKKLCIHIIYKSLNSFCIPTYYLVNNLAIMMEIYSLVNDICMLYVTDLYKLNDYVIHFVE